MKGYKETFGDYGYVHSFNCGDGFIGVYLCQITLVLYTLNMCYLLHLIFKVSKRYK